MKSKKLIKKQEEKKNLKQQFKNMIQLAEVFNNVVEEIRTNQHGELYVRLKDNLIIETKGSQLFYTRHGVQVNQARLIHLNPYTNNMEEDFENGNILNIENKANSEMIKNRTSKANKNSADINNKCDPSSGCC
ncbi:MAG: hypothetical protein H8D97_00955 [Proteobacteria bacterium]|nr:hypothetical protein [Pseudomonadota bacterium]